MLAKKVTALLVSAALAVSLLAACGSKALSSVMADLLTGLYDNVSVEVDNDLTAALKKAVSAGGTEEEILTALVNNLNLSSVSIAFSSLGSGQQGDHGVTLTFQTGNDPDAAARIALAQWASVFGSLPANGSYSASVAMIEAENGYYIAVDVEVLRAGSSGKDDEDDGIIRADGMTYDSAKNSATILNQNGLASLVDTLQTIANQDGETLSTVLGKTNITLNSDATLPTDWPYEATYEAIFDGGNNTVSGVSALNESGYNGMFARLTGTVENVKFENVAISNGNFNGAVTGYNKGGTVKNCEVLSGTISSSGVVVGGLVGWNEGTIEDSKVSGEVTVSSSNSYVGGLVGWNEGTIKDSNVDSSVTVSSGGSYVGGIVGLNNTTDAEILGCESSAEVTGEGSYIGGIAGQNHGTVQECVSSSNVSGNGTDSQDVGGVVGQNFKDVIYCSSSGDVTGTGTSVGGVIGYNVEGSTVIACCSTSKVDGKGTIGVGGVAGFNAGSLTACYSTGSVMGRTTSCKAGGVVGWNGGGAVTACYHANGSVTSEAEGTNVYVGGVVGYIKSGSVTACYWSSIGPTHGIGYPQSDTNATQVTGGDWTEATAAMNEAGNNLYAATGASAPKLTWE